MSSLAAAGPAAAQTAAGRSLPERLFAFVERSHLRACLVLVLLTLACCLPGFASLQPMDRDEPRFAQASKQMLETGDFVDIRFQDEARHKKPVGIYWLQSASVAAAEALGMPQARSTIALYRVPSLAGALATVLLAYWAALAFVPRRAAFLAAALVGSCVILMVEARLAKTDAVLAASATGALGALARAYLARGVGRLPLSTVLAFWTAIALGLLVKGPLILMYAGLCALVLCWRERSAAWLAALRPALGLALVVLVAAPWFLAIAWKSGGAFFQASVGQDMLGKVGTAQTYHWGPPGFYFATFFATFWPGAVVAAVAAPLVWRHRRDDGFAFALAWILPTWAILEAVPTKLPHYALPLYPAVAIATVAAMERGFVGPHRPGARLASLLIPLIPLGTAAAILFAAWRFGESLPLAVVPALLLGIVLAVLAHRAFLEDDAYRSILVSAAAAVAMAVAAFGLAQPAFTALRISPRLAEAVRAAGCSQVAATGFREPSLVFLVGTDLQLLAGGADASYFAASGGCRTVLVERAQEPLFELGLRTLAASALPTAGIAASPRLVTRVAGFNINGGKPVDVGVYRFGP